MKRKYNFRFDEFKCPCCEKLPPMTNELFDFYSMLQDFRDWYRKPININCSYRCEQFNKSVGGHFRSNHRGGFAIDWSTRAIPNVNTDLWRKHVVDEWLLLGKKYGYFVEVEISPTYVHLAINVLVDKNKNRIGTANGATSKIFRDYLKQ